MAIKIVAMFDDIILKTRPQTSNMFRIIVGSKPHSQAPITLCNLDIICSIKHETETKILANCEHNDVRTSPRAGESPNLCFAGKLIIGYSPRLYSHVDVMCENPGP